VFKNIESLENVYLAGGEPMLMKENLEFLQLLRERNPNCTVRINTNLSTTETGIFDLVCSFTNVHWTVSLETIGEQYEYVRHHGSWDNFLENLNTIKSLDHKISFNMLHFIMNYESLFDCVDYLKQSGFHDNSFVIGPLTQPAHLNILNLPGPTLERVVKKIEERLRDAQGYLKNSYENLLKYYRNTKWNRNIGEFQRQIKIMDQRRGNDCRKVFPKLFAELDAETLE
jgi:MoaA/NifB/PqqE/SkfB family radical SAM enzyme